MDPPQRPQATPVRTVGSLTDHYEIVGELGEGKYGKVVKGEHKETGELWAIKVMVDQGLDTKAAESAAHEREILRRLNHVNVIKLHEVLVVTDGTCLVMDLMQTDLYEYIKSNKSPGRGLEEAEAKQIMHQLLSGVQYLHQSGIVHRDIKPENILVNSSSDVRLADFGLAKVATIMNTPVGTSYYMAPEIVRAIEMLGHKAMTVRNVEDVKFIDMWSLGCVLYILLSGRPPFLGSVGDRTKRMHLLRQIDRGVLFPEGKAGKGWACVSANAKNLVTSLLTQETIRRLTAKAALEHPWFADGSTAESSKLPSEPTPDQAAATNLESSNQTEGEAEAEVTKEEQSAHIVSLRDEVAITLGDVDDEDAPEEPPPASRKAVQIRLPPKPSPKSRKQPPSTADTNTSTTDAAGANDNNNAATSSA